MAFTVAVEALLDSGHRSLPVENKINYSLDAPPTGQAWAARHHGGWRAGEHENRRFDGPTASAFHDRAYVLAGESGMHLHEAVAYVREHLADDLVVPRSGDAA